MDYREVEQAWPELAGLPTYSAAWYRRWRDLHLEAYPDADAQTRDNLAMFISMAEDREKESAP